MVYVSASMSTAIPSSKHFFEVWGPIDTAFAELMASMWVAPIFSTKINDRSI